MNSIGSSDRQFDNRICGPRLGVYVVGKWASERCRPSDKQDLPLLSDSLKEGRDATVIMEFCMVGIL